MCNLGGKNLKKKKFDDFNFEIGKYIRKIRVRKGLTGSELGELIGVSQQQVSRYERGNTILTLTDFMFILSVMDESFLDFIFASSLFDYDAVNFINCS